MTKKNSSIVFLIHNKKILFILRDDKDTIPEPNRWQLIAGEMEKGETFLETIQRECEEEVNVVPNNLELIGYIIKKSANSKHAIFYSFLSENEKNRLKKGDEGQRIEFLSVDDALELDLTEGIGWFLRRFGGGLKKLLENENISKEKLGFDKSGLLIFDDTRKHSEEITE